MSFFSLSSLSSPPSLVVVAAAAAAAALVITVLVSRRRLAAFQRHCLRSCSLHLHIPPCVSLQPSHLFNVKRFQRRQRCCTTSVNARLHITPPLSTPNPLYPSIPPLHLSISQTSISLNKSISTSILLSLKSGDSKIRLVRGRKLRLGPLFPPSFFP